MTVNTFECTKLQKRMMGVVQGELSKELLLIEVL